MCTYIYIYHCAEKKNMSKHDRFVERHLIPRLDPQMPRNDVTHVVPQSGCSFYGGVLRTITIEIWNSSPWARIFLVYYYYYYYHYYCCYFITIFVASSHIHIHSGIEAGLFWALKPPKLIGCWTVGPLDLQNWIVGPRFFISSWKPGCFNLHHPYHSYFFEWTIPTTKHSKSSRPVVTCRDESQIFPQEKCSCFSQYFRVLASFIPSSYALVN